MNPGEAAFEAFYKALDTDQGLFENQPPYIQRAFAAAERAGEKRVNDDPSWPATPAGRGRQSA